MCNERRLPAKIRGNCFDRYRLLYDKTPGEISSTLGPRNQGSQLILTLEEIISF